MSGPAIVPLEPSTFAEHSRWADVVMKAKIVSVFEPESLLCAVYVVRVSRVWKGSPTDLYAVATDFPYGARLTVGEEYLLFGILRQPVIGLNDLAATRPTLAFVKAYDVIKYDTAFDEALGPSSRPFPLVPLSLTLLGLVIFALLVARRRHRRAKR